MIQLPSWVNLGSGNQRAISRARQSYPTCKFCTPGTRSSEQELVDGRLDAFWIFAIMALGPLPLILLVKRSVARGEVAAH
jgi:hypothetical protein